jgi:hypothetical protein
MAKICRLVLLAFAFPLAGTAFGAPKTASKSTAPARSVKSASRASSRVSSRSQPLSDSAISNTSALAQETVDVKSDELSFKLLDECLKPKCVGASLPYEACFGAEETVDDYMRTDKVCLALFAKYNNTIIQDEARKKVHASIEKRHKDNCEQAYGEYSEASLKCKVEVCFGASKQSPNSGEVINKGDYCEKFEMGKTVNCSTFVFNVPDDKMYYRPDKTIEQQVQSINAIAGLVTTGITGGMNLFNALKTGKQMKEGQKDVVDGIFVFTGTTLNHHGNCASLELREGKTCLSTDEKDSLGNCYSKKPGELANKSEYRDICGDSKGSWYTSNSGGTIDLDIDN